MKRTVILTAALLYVLSPISHAKPLKVFILAGQSNMEGHAGVQTLDQLGEHPTHGHLLKKIKKADGSFVVRDDVFVSYKKGDEHIKRPLSVGMGAWGEEWFGPELMFGIEMGDHYKEPVLLIKTCWGGHNLYRDFRPPSAARRHTRSVTGKPEDVGASYHKMVKEVRECLANLDTDFPQLKGLKTELCGFVWFQGWNDMCRGEKSGSRCMMNIARISFIWFRTCAPSSRCRTCRSSWANSVSAAKKPTRTCSISGPPRRRSRRARN